MNLGQQIRTLEEDNQRLKAKLRELTEKNKHLSNKKHKLKVILDNINVGLIYFDRSGEHVLSFNSAAIDLHGFKDESEFLRQISDFPNLFDVLDSENQLIPLEDWLIPNAIRGNFLQDWEAKLIRKDNLLTRYISYSAFPVLDIEGNLSSFLLQMVDITARKHAEQSLQRSHKLLENILNVLPVGIFIADENGQISQTNTLAEIVWGGRKHVPIHQFDEYKGWWRNTGERLKADDWAFARAFKKGEVSIDEEIEIECFDGSRKIILNSAVPVYDEKRNIISAVAVTTDITQRKAAEEALHESNERLSAAIEGGKFGTWDLDLVSGIATRSLRHDQIWGFPDGVEEWGLETAMKKVHPDDQELISKAYDIAFKTGQLTHENRIIWPDGTIHWIAANGRIFYNDQGKPTRVIGVVADITERKQAEEAIKKQHEIYKIYTEAMPHMAFIADPAGNIIYINKKWKEYVNYQNELTVQDWRNIIYPDDLQLTNEKWKNSISTGNHYEIEYRLKRHDKVFRWHLGRANPVRDKNGKIEFWFGTNTDIHQQKETEELLKRANELNENLLYITAHDLKGPIANMHLALDLIDVIKDLEEKLKIVRTFKPSVEKIKNTIKGITEILQLQKADHTIAEKINLEHFVNELLVEHKDSLNTKNGVILTDFSQKNEISYIQPFLLSIITNLLSNSIKYCQEDVPLKIEISSRKESDFTLLIFKDNGVGIDLQSQEKILFTPFKRIESKKNTEGSGIGLYIIKSIIERNGGYIRVESEPAKGTSFFCYLKEY